MNKKTILGVASTLAFVALTALGGQSALANDKVTLCHAAGLDGTTHYVTLEVGYPAAFGPAGHFYENGTPQAGHEQDYLGPCLTDDPSPTPEPSADPTPEPTPSPSSTPQPSPSTETPTSTPTPSASTSTPARPVVTLPPTDTSASETTPTATPSAVLMFGVLIAVGAVAYALTLVRLQTRRNR